MRAVIQRVLQGSVTVDGTVVGEIKKGLVVLLGIGKEDDEKDLEYMIDKIIGLRIFQDENDKMNLSLLDIKGELLVISQFTLYGDVRKGKRPSFTNSGHPEVAERLYLEFVDKCKERGIRTEKGIFRADMDVQLINQGPVTIMLDSKKTF